MINNIRKRFGATASVVTLGLAMGTNAVTAESLDEVMERRGLSQKDLLPPQKHIRRPAAGTSSSCSLRVVSRVR